MNHFKLTANDIKLLQQDVLELFYSRIKSAETKRTMDGNLKRFLVDACEDILKGDYPQRAPAVCRYCKKRSRANNRNYNF